MKKTASVIAVAVLALGVMACSAKQGVKTVAAKTKQPASASKQSQLYIEVSALGSLDYFYDHKMGMKQVGKDLGVRTQYVGPATYDMNAMISDMEQAIAEKPDGLVVVGFEPSLDPIVNKAVDAGIPVVTVDSDLPGSKRIAFVGTGNFNAGVTGGKEMAKLIGDKGEVAIMTKVGQDNLEQRVAGYKSALGKFPNIKVVQIVNDKSDPVVAAEVAGTLLQKYPNLAGIACVEAAGGSGAATAVREAHKIGKVKIISMDRGREVLKAIGNGVIQASVAQQTALMPFYAVQILYNLKNNPVAISTNNKSAGVPGAPINVDTGSFIVDKSNYKYFMR